MKHIALRSTSMRRDMPYTTPGLGDRAHSILIGYQYAKSHNTQVCLHLTKDKYGKEHKKTSWKQLSELTHGLVTYQVHDVSGLDEHVWEAWLFGQGIDAEIYYYKDTLHMHPREKPVPLEISQYLKVLPCMDPIDCSSDLDLPEKFVTMQWDSTDASRQVSPIKLHTIKEKYIENGYELITVGGSSENEFLRTSLAHAGYAISKAGYHIGIDSGIMHLAQFYKPYDKIHIYNDAGFFKSHHLVRAQANGSKINPDFL